MGPNQSCGSFHGLMVLHDCEKANPLSEESIAARKVLLWKPQVELKDLSSENVGDFFIFYFT